MHTHTRDRGRCFIICSESEQIHHKQNKWKSTFPYLELNASVGTRQTWCPRYTDNQSLFEHMGENVVVNISFVFFNSLPCLINKLFNNISSVSIRLDHNMPVNTCLQKEKQNQTLLCLIQYLLHQCWWTKLSIT